MKENKFTCLEPVCPLFFGASTLQNKGDFPIKTGGPIWVLGIYIYIGCIGRYTTGEFEILELQDGHHTALSLAAALSTRRGGSLGVGGKMFHGIPFSLLAWHPEWWFRGFPSKYRSFGVNDLQHIWVVETQICFSFSKYPVPSQWNRLSTRWANTIVINGVK